MRSPLGLLDQATAIELTVIDGDQAQCDPNTGRVSGSPSGDAVQSFDLDHGGCSGGVSWCKTITLDKDGSSKVFRIAAQGGGKQIAQGCATAVIDQDPLEVTIKAYRFNPPKCCNDGVLQPGEQCDDGIPAPTDCAGNGGEQACLGVFPDDVCECDCLAKEILVTVPGTGPTTSNGPGTKSEMQLAFSGASGNSADVVGSLRAVYTDTDSQAASDIDLRLFLPDLRPVSDALNKQLRLPECSKIFSSVGRQRDQKQAAISMVSSSVVGVAFASDEIQPTLFGIYVSPQGPDGCADSATTPIVQVNATTTESAESPAIAGGPEGSALVVWNAGGNLRGRIWQAADPTNLTPANNDIEIGSIAGGARPRVAGNANGWVVVYAGGSGVLLNTVSTSASVDSPQNVDQAGAGADHPDVAMQGDGSFMVVWHAGNSIAFQRYGATGNAVAGDQDQPLTMHSPPASEPAVAASGSAGDFYAVVWTADDGTIWSRFVGTSAGFGFNSVDGQNGDYQASHPAVAGQRSQPSVAVGASGYVAIGWLDSSVDHYGLYLRRFPVPEIGGAL